MSYKVKKSQDGKRAVIGKFINSDIIGNIKNSANENDIFCCVVQSMENIPDIILNKYNVMTDSQFTALDVDHIYIRNTDKFDIEHIAFTEEKLQLNNVSISKGEKIINILFIAGDISDNLCIFIRLEGDIKKRIFPVYDFERIRQFINENNATYNSRKFGELLTGLGILGGLKLLS